MEIVEYFDNDRGVTGGSGSVESEKILSGWKKFFVHKVLNLLTIGDLLWQSFIMYLLEFIR